LPQRSPPHRRGPDMRTALTDLLMGVVMVAFVAIGSALGMEE
jgi:hypothetical protein